MFEKIKKRRENKKKRKPPERFLSLTANGKSIPAVNFAMAHDEDGTPRLDVVTREVCEDLHYDTVDFVMKTNTKQIDVSARFRSARDEKKFKVYTFDVDDYNQYFI